MITLAFDTETALVQPGLLAPPLVCSSTCADDLTEGSIWSADDTRQLIRGWLSEHTIEGANLVYDMGVLLADDPTLVDLIFKLYREGRARDVQTSEALQAIAKGHLFKDPRTGGDLRNPETGKMTGRYSLAVCADLHGHPPVLKKDTWRLTYAKLGGVPLSEWPAAAVEYPKRDASATRAVGRDQEGGPNMDPRIQTHENRAHLALHLAGIWGIRTDPARVQAVATRVEREWEEGISYFEQLGFMREDGTEDQAAIKTYVARVYGAAQPCGCDGGHDLGRLLKNGKRSKIRGKTCRECRGTGLNLTGIPVPRTPSGDVSISRDTLKESGDDALEAYGKITELAKLRETYIPYLWQGTKVPINLSANVIVATGRVSYDGLIQLLPRKGGIRDAFVARDGFTFCSVDYSMLELCTLAQVHVNMFGRSALADAINRGDDLHTRLAATVYNLNYEELIARVKSEDKTAKNMRQMMKPANFGFPGGMSAPKVVATARKDGTRFCELAGVEPKCGREKLAEWKGHPIPPTCKACCLVAEKVRQGWLRQWREMPAYFDVIKKLTKDYPRGEIKSFGNGMIRGGCRFTEASNHRFQNLAAQGAKHALWLVSEECHTNRRSPLWGCHPIAFLHDEIFSELVSSRAHEAANRKAEIMVNAMREFTPDVLIKAEPALAHHWYKDMSPRFQNGRLIEWSPK